jgi:large subunit ribosomal protein L29
LKKWVVKPMKARELQDFRQSSPQDLQVKLSDLKTELFNLRFQLATGQLENPMRIKEVKKSIAQIKTIIREEEIRAFEQ